MKPFAVWLALTLLVFVAFSGGYHVYLTKNPRKIAVAVDTSYPMRAAWGQVGKRLADLTAARYTQFALLTEKGRIHSWSDRLETGELSPYAPRDLSGLGDASAFPEIADADKRVLLTNAPPDRTDPLKRNGWDIVDVTP